MLSSVRPGKGRLRDDLVVDLCSTLFLQDCVAVNPQDVVDTANFQTLSEQSAFRLRVLADLDAFLHRSDDVCLAQELVRDPTATPSVVLPSVTVKVLATLRTSPILPLGWRCIQITHAANDFRFQWIPLCSDSAGVRDVGVRQKKGSTRIR